MGRARDITMVVKFPQKRKILGSLIEIVEG